MDARWRLLVLDDDLHTLEGWAALLQDAGHEVEGCMTGRQGSEVLRMPSTTSY